MEKANKKSRRHPAASPPPAAFQGVAPTATNKALLAAAALLELAWLAALVTLALGK